jgi:phosphate transport system substrate-binding protein
VTGQLRAWGAMAATILVVAGCTSSAPTVVSPAAGVAATADSAVLSGTINASGSTFQLTFQEVAISGFRSVQPGITVNYDGIGSGGGRDALAASTVSFAGSDSPIPST